MDKKTYWIPIRTIGGPEQDQIMECSNCGNLINMYDIEELRFKFARRPEVYSNAIETQYEVCEKCGEKMDTYITFELRQRRVAKGDMCLEETVEKIIKDIQ